MTDEVRNSGNHLTPEEIAARREAFRKIQKEGHTIELTTQEDDPKHSGVSYDYMDRLNQDIEAGIFEDVGHDGFTNKDKKGLGQEFESVFSEHGYSTKFTRMKAGEKYDISYDDYIRLAKAAGYELVQEKAVPQEQKDNTEPADNTAARTEEPEITTVQTVVTVEIPEDYEVEDVEVRSSIINNPNDSEEGNNNTVIDNKVTVIYEDEEDNQSQDTKTTGKATQEPDALPTQAPADKASRQDSNDGVAFPGNSGSGEDLAVSSLDKPGQTDTSAITNVDASETPVADNKEETQATYADSEEELNEFFENDAEMADKTNEERIAIVNQRIDNLDSQIADLEKTTETYKTRKFFGFGGKTKTRELPAEVVQERKEQADKLRTDKDKLTRYQVYAQKVLGDKYWNGSYTPGDLTDEQGNTVEQHSTYTKTQVVDENGNTRRVIRTRTWEETGDGQDGTPGYTDRYYPIDVQKVGDPNTGSGVRWEVVPDKEHELTNVRPTT